MKFTQLEIVETSRPGGLSIKIGKPGYREYVDREHYLGGPFSVAEVCCEDADYQSIEEETRQYARLIAAAPELLEALSLALEIAKAGIRQYGDDYTVQRFIDIAGAAKAAIAKAEQTFAESPTSQAGRDTHGK